MSDFAITVNNRRYTIACPAESEPRLELAARQLDEHVRPLAERYGKVGDDRLLLLAALQIIDDLMTTRDKLAEINYLIAKSEQLSALVEAEAAADDSKDAADDAADLTEAEEPEQEEDPLDLSNFADIATVGETDDVGGDDEIEAA